NLEIWIDAGGKLYLDGLPSELTTIEDALGEVYRTAPGTRVHIIADRNTPFREVNAVIRLLQLLEYRVVSFVVKDG
ncbi:MAG: biopolymer transporter ExbD, partial [Treponema sp.]|nr:biopolymer transporter ExbD [Treponema sp.]